MPFLIIMLLLIGGAFNAWAGEPPPEQTTTAFNRLAERLREHPEIQAYVEKARSQRLYGDGEKGLPDPMLMVGVQDYPLGSGSRDQQETMVGFKQEIPGFGIRDAKINRAHAESEKTRLMADYAFAAMKAKLAMALADLQRIKEQEDTYKQQQALFDIERKSLAGRITANQSEFGQFTMSQAEEAEVKLALNDLKEQRHGMQAMLTNMLGEAPDIAPPAIEMAAWSNDTDATYPVVITGQDIRIAHREIDQRNAEYGPNFEIQANYGRMASGDNTGALTAGISIPLWASVSQEPRLQAAKASLRVAESDADMTKRGVVEKLTHLKAQIETTASKIEVLNKKQDSLNQSASAAVREYEAGKADLPSVLKAKRDALNIRALLAAERAKRLTLIADFNHYFIQGEPK